MKNNLVRYDNDGLELIIDESNGEVFASQNAIARMCNVNSSTIRKHIISRGVQQTAQTLPVIDSRGVQQTSKLFGESVIKQAIAKYNPELLLKCVDAGLRVYLYGLAGYEVKPIEPIKPKTALELAKEQVKILEQLELQEKVIKSLESDSERLAEVMDELFDYSSITRIAKYNNCHQKAFSWRKLKEATLAMGLEIKKMPDPNCEVKNLYPHAAWRFVYPEYRLPETTTLRIEPKV